nr:MAG: Prophage endopeptidase tail [Bacteriophage sp.]
MALTKKVNFTRFSRFGANLGRLTYTAATHEDATDGTDELKIKCEQDLSKGERLVWVDRQGVVHEHIVDEIERLHDDSGKPYTSVTCINSINETWDDYIEDKRPSGSVAVALASILAGTRWEVGACDQPGTASHTFYHVKVREGLSDLLKTWGGELETVIETDGVQVTHRYVRIVATRGNQQSPKRFTWTKDLISIKRKTGSANPKTRVYGYGKGVETDGGGYGRRLTFGDINGGKDYVEDAAATEVWGHPDGSGGIAPAVDVYVNEQCEDAAQLLAETNDYLEQAKTPTVSYEANVIDLFAFGRDWESVAVGDCVAIIDKGFSAAGIRLKGRVSKLIRDLVTGDATVTFGNLTDDLADIFQSMAQQLKSGSHLRANYDAAAGTSVSWLNQLMAALNKAFNAVGTYKVETFELGVIYSNVPLDAATGVPLKATSGMWAVNINGMGIRLAASLTSDSQWNWRTFITGAQVSADCINAGTMRADRIRAGLLTDEVGKNYWDMTTGEFSLSAGTTVDNKQIATADTVIASRVKLYAKNQSDTVPPINAQNPERGWSETLPEWSNGYYIWSMERVTFGDSSVRYTTPALESAYNKAYQSSYDLNESLTDLDGTVQDLAKDGVVTTAEAAAVKKAMQAVDKEREELTNQYNSLKSNKSLNPKFIAQILTPKYTAAFGSTEEGGAYSDYAEKVNAVLRCKTADTLKAAMYEYDASYGAYSSAVKNYASAARAAQHAIEQQDASDYADGILSNYDEQMTQQEIFNRLTGNGTTQGIFLKSGLVYINASYMSAGTIADAKGRNSWNLKTGDLTTNYMTANNITAKGTFRCGYDSYYTVLNAVGQMSGYRKKSGASSASQVGYIDFSASSRDIPTGEIRYGLQMQAEGSLRISVPHLSISNSADTNTTAIYGITENRNLTYISKIQDNGNGTISWWTSTAHINFINGICTSCSFN